MKKVSSSSCVTAHLDNHKRRRLCSELVFYRILGGRLVSWDPSPLSILRAVLHFASKITPVAAGSMPWRKGAGVQRRSGLITFRSPGDRCRGRPESNPPGSALGRGAGVPGAGPIHSKNSASSAPSADVLHGSVEACSPDPLLREVQFRVDSANRLTKAKSGVLPLDRHGS